MSTSISQSSLFPSNDSSHSDSSLLSIATSTTTLTQEPQQNSNTVSDWAILNQAHPNHVRRLCTALGFKSAEVQQKGMLLEHYHAVYRRAWMQLRQTGYRGICPPPSSEQLQQIGQLQETILANQPYSDLKSETLQRSVLAELHAIAALLRSPL